MPRLAEQNILGLEVPVYDVAAMQIFERQEYLGSIEFGHGLWEFFVAPE